MTKTEMRIAIAECCGWTGIYQRMSSGKYLGFLQGTDIKTKRSEEIPNYPEDLNAMHEAECYGIKSDEEADSYARYLHILAGSEMPFESISLMRQMRLIRASALQRAEAFLRVKGLWKD